MALNLVPDISSAPNPIGILSSGETDSESSKSQSISGFEIFKTIAQRNGLLESENSKCMNLKKLLETQTTALQLILTEMTWLSSNTESEPYKQRRNDAHVKLFEIKQTLQDFEAVLNEMSIEFILGPLQFISAHLRRLVKSMILLRYYEEGEMLSLEEVGQSLGIPLAHDRIEGTGNPKPNKILLDTNIYFSGMLLIGKDLLNYSMVAAQSGNRDRCEAVMIFLNEMMLGFTYIEQKSNNLEMKVDQFEENDMKEINKLIFQLKIRDERKKASDKPHEPDPRPAKQEYKFKFPQCNPSVPDVN